MDVLIMYTRIYDKFLSNGISRMDSFVILIINYNIVYPYQIVFFDFIEIMYTYNELL